MIGKDPPAAGGGGTGTPSTPSTPPQPVQPARCTAPGTTRATINTHALHVWLQAVDQLSSNCNDASLIAQGIQSRLQSLFTLVAGRPGPPAQIQVLWTTNIASETVGSRDIVIYFVNCYAPGSGTIRRRGNTSVVERYLHEREAATSGSLSQQYHALRQQFFSPLSSPSEAGLCVPDTDGTTASNSTSVCEVYIDVMTQANPVPAGAANRAQLLQNNLGFAIAGMAFHEAMHNKIDPFQGSGWNLHTSGGGGLAQGTLSGGQTHTQQNINLMGQHVNRVRRQYILQPAAASQPATPPASGGASGTPTTPATPSGSPAPAQPASPSSTPIVSDDPLGGIDLED
jgi:hypothetical protein